MVFDRGMIAYLDDKKVTINSFNIINKMLSNSTEVVGDELIFKTDNEISKYIYKKSSCNMSINLEAHSEEITYLNVDLKLKRKSCGSLDVDEYIIEEYTKKSDLTNKDLLMFLSHRFRGNFLVLKDDEYCIIHKEKDSDYYYKGEWIIPTFIYDRIMYHIKDHSLYKCGLKISELISYDFYENMKECNHNVENSNWSKLEQNCTLQIVY